MKQAINTLGVEVTVEDTVVVKTVNGVHHLLSATEMADRADAELAAEAARADYEANHKYKDDRAAAYPSIAEQMDMQYHDSIDSTSTWKDAILAVKTLYPKPVA